MRNRNLPRGMLDVVSDTRVRGWVVDLDIKNAGVTVMTYVDGKPAACQVAYALRPVLERLLGNGSHGFDMTLPPMSAGSHHIGVYGIDLNTGQRVRIWAGNVLSAGTLRGNVDVVNGSTVRGWAFATAAGAAPVNVAVSIDGGLPIVASASETRTDLLHECGSTGHGFSVALPALSAGIHRVTVYALMPDGSTIKLLGTRDVTVV
jgi:hypothetical protein